MSASVTDRNTIYSSIKIARKTIGRMIFNRSLARFEFIFARPLQAVAGRQIKLLLEESVSPGAKAAIVSRVQIQVNVHILVPDHR